MSTTVHGIIREGREVSVDQYDWSESRVTVRVSAASNQVAVLAVRDWFQTEVETILPWRGTKYACKSLSADGGVYDVDVTLTSWVQLVSDPNSPEYRGFSATLEELESEVDVTGLPIVVQHTYPPDDPDWPSETRYQGASVRIPRAVFTYVNTLSRRTWFPEAYQWLQGYANSHVWRGHQPGYVRCSQVRPIPIQGPYGGRPPVWAIQFTFDVCFSGWDQVAVYIDPRTNKRPSTATELTGGIKSVLCLPRYNFNLLFDTSNIPSWQEIWSAEGL